MDFVEPPLKAHCMHRDIYEVIAEPSYLPRLAPETKVLSYEASLFIFRGTRKVSESSVTIIGHSLPKLVESTP